MALNKGDNQKYRNQGFASMDEDKQLKIANMGGKAAYGRDTVHEFDSEEAREASLKGRQSSHGRDKTLILA